MKPQISAGSLAGKILISAPDCRSAIGNILPLGLLLCLIWFPESAQARKGDDIIRRVQAKFKSLNTLAVHFEMRFEAGGAPGVNQEEGRLFLDDEGRFRMETQEQILVYNGETLWQYSPADHQVIVYGAKSAPHVLTPHQLLFEYPDKYNIIKVEKTEYSGRLCYLLNMVPREDTDPTKQLKVWVDREQSLTRKFFLENLAGNVTIFEFEAFEFNVELPAGTFDFVPPEGTEIIDMR